MKYNGLSIASMISAYDNHNVIQLKVVNGKISKGVDQRRSNKIVGEKAEVYAFRTKEEISAMFEVFDNHIKSAPDANKRQIACRNKLLFAIGMNVGIRASDLRELKWSFFLNSDYTVKEEYSFQPIKQKKQKKFVTLFFNETVKAAINWYTSEYPVENLNTYLFPSRKGNEPISVRTLWHIIKDIAAEAGIEQNIGSHSLRKSWGFWCWHDADDKNEALVKLMNCFNHSSTQVTLRYIGITKEETAKMYRSIELGLDCIKQEM